MTIPRFLLGDNASYPDDIFIIHTEYPRFIINLKDDSIEFLEEISKADKEDLEEETKNLIEEASRFYDEQMEFYENNE
ncbi:hypothetical protein JCM19294_947 [Nonlabens tegetincola]|uniref:Uncharacterized protein n=1 Tax=Nonlabens tegetincola TaxID=323273 RepID=A0A090Q972_9FLAO|nr:MULTISPECIES: hypothetical protein [Nonlabens]ALM21842.1 hypothetical protein AAT17_11645 [Nonlabens sp. MIC269]ARN71425.1 hypothetical protein BST91_07120 [Nonlabens tegetincola]PQJ13933.1 hypothetical protein BST93_11755 [Nonlabens tegetincola]GAK98313.1 hypothetical protein JCM19294_947 [Nonlabens tegetincola]